MEINTLGEKAQTINFTPIKSNIIDRQHFYTSHANLLDIQYCPHGVTWNIGFRESCIRRRIRYHTGYRCIPVSEAEFNELDIFHKTKKTDIFYQFKATIPKLPIQVTHFQVRKNFLLLDDKELIYTKRYGIESYNLITQKKNTLCVLSPEDQEHEDRNVICFDIIKNKDDDYLICAGRADGSIKLYKVPKDEFKYVKELNIERIPKFENYLTQSISHGEGVYAMTCYVKFSDNGSTLLTCHNDGFIRIFDLRESLKLTVEYNNEGTPVNHCSFNSSGGVLACIGDSVDIALFETRTNKRFKNFKAHYDYGSVVRFQPNSDYLFASGNQDFTAKIWDIRMLESHSDNTTSMATSVKTLYGFFESIADLLYVEDQFLIYAESLDYVHIYNLKNDTTQTITFLGKLAGIQYNTLRDELIIGSEESTEDIDLGGIMIFDKIKNYKSNINSILF
jgi:hypothetical protein